MSEASTLSVSVWRDGEEGKLFAYSIPLCDNQAVLNAVTICKQNAVWR